MIGPVFHDSRKLRDELLRASSPVVFDTETTGKDARRARVLSYGFRIDGVNHVLFTPRCSHPSIQRYVSDYADIRNALEAIRMRGGLMLVGHNIKYDLILLQREGSTYTGECRDTLGLLRLLDQDRGFSTVTDEDDTSRLATTARYDLAAPGGIRYLNYRLKDVVANLCGIRAMYTPSKSMLLVPYRTHTTYLCHDLYVTERLYQYLWTRLTPQQRLYYRRVGSPLLHVLRKLTEEGLRVDTDYIDEEITRLSNALTGLSDRHEQKHGLPLLKLGDWTLRKLLYRQYGLPIIRGRKKRGAVGVDTLQRLLRTETNPAIADSLRLIIGFQQAKSMLGKLREHKQHVNHCTGRVHSLFDDRQSTGRVSSSSPNVQQIAKERTIAKGTAFETVLRNRNMVVPSSGHVLVAADIDNADVRILAHMIDECDLDTDAHWHALLRRRDATIRHLIRPFDLRRLCRNQAYKGSPPQPLPNFDPDAPSPLVRNFRELSGDLYATVASEIIGKRIERDDPLRGTYKTVFLALINGQSIDGLKKQLQCSRSAAKAYADRFFTTYPDIAGYLALMRQQVAVSGETSTWPGRVRTMTAQKWMVQEPRVRILLTYSDGNRYWFDVVPIAPGYRNLTCYARRIWSVADPERPKLIYDHQRGRLGSRKYPQIDNPSLLYQLPMRNLPWGKIRRVQKLNRVGEPIEEAKYKGLDATVRTAVNAIMQGGTADLTFKMMICTRHLSRYFSAPLILQVHDELVWECPEANVRRFVRAVWPVLEKPPTPGFRVPITVTMHKGSRYGEMVTLQRMPRLTAIETACELSRPIRRKLRRFCPCRHRTTTT